MIFRYDLAYDIASFDFYTPLVIAAEKGATEVVFGIDSPKQNKWSADIVLKRFHSIIEPGPALLGLPYRIGEGGERPQTPHMKSLVEWCRQGKSFPRLKTVLPPGNAKYTVTLRRDQRLRDRNSDEKSWRRFADQIGALVIEDYDVDPIGLHERFALYAGAEMNFGIPNGPMHLILLSDYPLAMFKCNHCAGAFANCGIAFGEQWSWHRENQFAVWEMDDYGTLMRWFENWSASR